MREKTNHFLSGAGCNAASRRVGPGRWKQSLECQVLQAAREGNANLKGEGNRETGGEKLPGA